MPIQRIFAAGRQLHTACRGGGVSQAIQALSANTPFTTERSACSCGRQQVCSIHGTSAALANPDNKPSPKGKEKEDPSNTGQDQLSHDPDDSEAYAPGYYDDEGVKGGHRRVASQEESKQVPKRKPDAEWQDYHPETKEDPNQPEPEDPNKADIPDPHSGIKGYRQNPASDSAGDAHDPNRNPPVGEDTQVAEGQMPDQETQLAGMPEAASPPHPGTTSAPPEEQAASTDRTSPFGDPTSTEDIEQPGKRILDEGRVKPGKPEPINDNLS